MRNTIRPSVQHRSHDGGRTADLSGLRHSLTQGVRRRRKRRSLSLPRLLAILLLAVAAVPVADAIAGSGHASVGCQLVSIVDGDTVTLDCPGHDRREHQIMGLASPPVLGARCLSEAWWGIRSEIALRTKVWQSRELEFIIEPRARLALVFADGVPLHRLISPVPRDLCT